MVQEICYNDQNLKGFRGADACISSLFWAGSSIGRALDLQSGRLGSNPTVSTSAALAQLGEHLPYKQEAVGSSPSSRTLK